MSILYTAAAAVHRGLCISSQIYAPTLFTAVKKFSTVPQPAKEEEDDVLYKRCILECRSAEPAVLKSYSTFVQAAARELGIKVGECITPKKAHHYRWSVLKSVFIYAKAQVQYEVRTHFTTMHFLHLTGSTADTFLEYVERNLPEGVGMKVTRVRLERMPDHLKTPPDVHLAKENSPADAQPKQIAD